MRYRLASPYITGAESGYVSKAIKDNWISSIGENVDRFERAISSYIGAGHGISTVNCTVALHLALLGLGIKERDEVIVPDLTFAATINSVLHARATPVIVDIERESWCMSPEKFEKAITPRTKAVIVVHLYGQPCNMGRIMEIASRHRIKVIEDCAEALGARYAENMVGSFGDVGCFSFYGNKIITTGEGGMCVTDDSNLADRIRILKNHGMSGTKKYWHEVVGYNYRMTNLQASIGLGQVEKLDYMLKRRAEIEKIYHDELSGIGCLEPQEGCLKDRKKVVWLVSYQLNLGAGRRDALMRKLSRIGVETRPFFYPMSEMRIYRKYSRHKNPVSKEVSAKGISFPTNLNLSKDDYQVIVDGIKKCVKNITKLKRA